MWRLSDPSCSLKRKVPSPASRPQLPAQGHHRSYQPLLEKDFQHSGLVWELASESVQLEQKSLGQSDQLEDLADHLVEFPKLEITNVLGKALTK